MKRNHASDFEEIGGFFLISSVSSWRSPFLITFSTIDWPSLCGFEWYFTLISTFRTSRLMHCSGSAKVSIPHFFHLLLIDYTLPFLKGCILPEERTL